MLPVGLADAYASMRLEIASAYAKARAGERIGLLIAPEAVRLITARDQD